MIKVERGYPEPHVIEGLPAGWRVQPIRGSLGVVDGYSLVRRIDDDRSEYVGLPDDADSVREIGEALVKLAARMDESGMSQGKDPEMPRG